MRISVTQKDIDDARDCGPLLDLTHNCPIGRSLQRQTGKRWEVRIGEDNSTLLVQGKFGVLAPPSVNSFRKIFDWLGIGDTFEFELAYEGEKQ